MERMTEIKIPIADIVIDEEIQVKERHKSTKDEIVLVDNEEDVKANLSLTIENNINEVFRGQEMSQNWAHLQNFLRMFKQF
jgi:hypothetical protein